MQNKPLNKGFPKGGGGRGSDTWKKFPFFVWKAFLRLVAHTPCQDLVESVCIQYSKMLLLALVHNNLEKVKVQRPFSLPYISQKLL